jgi:hypothetical protein
MDEKERTGDPMTIAEFTITFRRLLDAHGKSFHEGISESYYNQFQMLTLKQWEDVIQSLVRSTETFPKIPTITKIIGEKGYWNSSTANSGMYSFVCSCGQSMATNAGRLTKAIEERMSFKCPNNPVHKCNKTYSAEYFMKNSKYIGAIQ